jgi:hypothetical protein
MYIQEFELKTPKIVDLARLKGVLNERLLGGDISGWSYGSPLWAANKENTVRINFRTEEDAFIATLSW